MVDKQEVPLEEIILESPSVSPNIIVDIKDEVRGGIGSVIANAAQSAVKSGAINSVASQITNTVGQEISNNPKCSFLNNNKVYALLLTLIGLGIGGLIEFLILKYLKIDVYDSQI